MSIAIVLLVNTVIGSVIAGLTNEGAIRYILRRTIPGRKKELAAAVQKVITTELMTSESIIEWLKQSRGALEQNVGQWLDAVLDSDLPSVENIAGEHLGQTGVFRLGQWRAKCVEQLAEVFSQYVHKETFAEDVLGPAIQTAWQRYRDCTIDELLPGLRETFLKAVVAHFERLLALPETHRKIVSVFSGLIHDYLRGKRYVGELFPEAVKAMLRKAVCTQDEHLSKQIVSLLDKPEVQEMLVAMISEAVDAECRNSLLLGVAKSFVGIDARIQLTCRQLPQKTAEILSKPESREQIRTILGEYFDSLMTREWRSFFDSQMDVENLIAEKMLETFLRADGNWIPQIIEFFADELRRRTTMPLAELPGIAGNEPQVIQSVSRALVSALRSDYCAAMLRDNLLDISELLVNKPIGRLSQWCSDDLKEKAAKELSGYILLLVQEKLDDFTEKTGIWNIISQSVNNFDDKKTEQMIRNVCNNELRWVTALGFIWGAVFGFFQGLINLFIYL